MSVYDMIGRIESDMSAVEATSLDSYGNKSDVMEMDLRYFHGPDNHLYWNGAVELGDYVIDCAYQKLWDDLFDGNDKLRAVYDKAKTVLSAKERETMRKACYNSVDAECNRYRETLAQWDAELA